MAALVVGLSAGPAGAAGAVGAAASTSIQPATALSTAALAATPRATCDTRWGTGAKGNLPVSLSRNNHLTGVRAGRHSCFDRVVVDLDGTLANKGYSVRYVRSVTQDGSGNRVPLRGGAAIAVVIGAPAYDAKGQPTYRPRNPAELVNTRGFRTLRQAAFAGSFEGQTTLGLGVTKRTPMRAFVLRGTDGDRLVIDIAHR
ncbi:hypothetical protein BJY21_002853 [Kineosphaera limosa]|uniref:AMIN-like domain-containing protein n=1 Tax=Kineosphaera limosa NBRC 100340 TaxID=1184609 RepID=K6VMJ6_9MICO|nr:hypothetical protein [Kineosphaera limosa]NYE01669.1 hypothetical protein [Kineosphaera limosa]GAB97438.1 hypothetical protein KILIM_069_00060 [Kineosphaera limosa NBRC 100340]